MRTGIHLPSVLVRVRIAFCFRYSRVERLEYSFVEVCVDRREKGEVRIVLHRGELGCVQTEGRFLRYRSRRSCCRESLRRSADTFSAIVGKLANIADEVSELFEDAPRVKQQAIHHLDEYRVIGDFGAVRGELDASKSVVETGGTLQMFGAEFRKVIWR